jgi:hypothetical protein
MNKDTADLLFETLDAINKHTSRLNGLDKKSLEHSSKLGNIVSTLEKQIEVSTKDVLLKLLEQGNTDKEQLVKDISSVIAKSIGELTINAGDISVNVDTNPIAKAISTLPINNTNNIVVDTSVIEKDNKEFLGLFKTISNNLNESMLAIKLIFQEMNKKEKPKVIKELPVITGMTVTRDKDGLIQSVEFIR